ncbi:hypothetical protein Sjap_009743 [Stephania japonica]|uniref:Cytochrome P450 n=1 Tax=Stephania japonica TaxID=461633 RepID=A0AAP0JAB9_9MAGN
MTMLSLIVVCATTLFVIYITHWVYRWRNPKCNGGKLPPGSMGFPFIGETFELRRCSDSLDVHSFFKKRIQKYGSIFRTSLAGRQVVVSSDPNFIHFILQQEGKLVDLWYMDTFTKILGQDDPSILAIGSITKYFKSLILTHFGIETTKNNLLPKLEALSKQSLSSWSSQPSINVKEAVSSMVFNCTSGMLFGYDPIKSSQEDLGLMFTNFLRSILYFPVNIPGTAFHESLKNQKMVLEMIKDVMKRRRHSSSSSSLPDEEIKHRRRDALDDVMEDMKREVFLTDDFSAFVMFSLIIASSETISASLSLAIKLLTEHPLALKELRDEHEAILQMRKENITNNHQESCITWEEYKSMTFTSYVINETLRLANLTPGIIRRARNDINYDGYIIPKGWTVVLVTSTLHLNSVKFPDPLVFNPWRWKDIGKEITRKDFLVFGGGLRVCPGAEFSKAFIGTFLHAIVTNYTWKKTKGGDVIRDPALTFKDDLYIQVRRSE